jgi:hypothetical protein
MLCAACAAPFEGFVGFCKPWIRLAICEPWIRFAEEREGYIGIWRDVEESELLPMELRMSAARSSADG